MSISTFKPCDIPALATAGVTLPPAESPPAAAIDAAANTILTRLRSEGLDTSDDAIHLVTRHAAVVCLSEHRGTPPPDRGLLLFGQVGSGKTTLVRRAYARIRSVFFITAQQIISDALKYPDSFATDRRELMCRHVILDDLGSEPDARRFGNAVDLAEWIGYRYEAFTRKGSLTILTTNLTSRMITDRYGQRILSRLKEMTAPILYNHPDRRVSRPWSQP